MRRVSGRTRAGFAAIELTVSIVLILMIAVFAGSAVFGFQRSHDRHTWRQIALWAAEAQYQRMLAGASADSRPSEECVAEGVELAVETQPGEGQWQGFQRVTITAKVTVSSGGTVTEQVRGYVKARSSS